MSAETEITKVVFRKFDNGEIIALFPEIPGTNDVLTMSSYMHVGQHGSAHLSVVSNTKLATEEDYSSLKNELENIVGYNLRVSQRITKKDAKIRLLQIRESYMKEEIEDTKESKEETEESLEGESKDFRKGYNKGFDVGHKEGFDIGFFAGDKEGREEGHNEGYDTGHKEGYEEGYLSCEKENRENWEEAACGDGVELGYDACESENREAWTAEGHEAGYEEGKDQGYDAGHEEGEEAGFNNAKEVFDETPINELVELLKKQVESSPYLLEKLQDELEFQFNMKLVK